MSIWEYVNGRSRPERAVSGLESDGGDQFFSGRQEREGEGRSAGPRRDSSPGKCSVSAPNASGSIPPPRLKLDPHPRRRPQSSGSARRPPATGRLPDPGAVCSEQVRQSEPLKLVAVHSIFWSRRRRDAALRSAAQRRSLTHYGRACWTVLIVPAWPQPVITTSPWGVSM